MSLSSSGDFWKIIEILVLISWILHPRILVKYLLFTSDVVHSLMELLQFFLNVFHLILEKVPTSEHRKCRNHKAFFEQKFCIEEKMMIASNSPSTYTILIVRGLLPLVPAVPTVSPIFFSHVFSTFRLIDDCQQFEAAAAKVLVQKLTV